MTRRSQPEHVGRSARAIAEAAASAFGSGIALTRRYIKLRASRPTTFLVGVRVEVRHGNGVTAQRFEQAADAGFYVTQRMRALETCYDTGAEVVAFIERPARTEGDVVREVLVHRRLEGTHPDPDGPMKLSWAVVSTRPEVITADARVDDEGGES